MTTALRSPVDYMQYANLSQSQNLAEKAPRLFAVVSDKIKYTTDKSTAWSQGDPTGKF
jgi:hypothetical protein